MTVVGTAVTAKIAEFGTAGRASNLSRSRGGIIALGSDVPSTF